MFLLFDVDLNEHS